MTDEELRNSIEPSPYTLTNWYMKKNGIFIKKALLTRKPAFHLQKYSRCLVVSFFLSARKQKDADLKDADLKDARKQK